MSQTAVECHELDVDARTDGKSLPENSTTTAWGPKQEEVMQKAAGRITGEKLKAQMEEARFVDVVVEEFKVLIGQWPMDKVTREAGQFSCWPFRMG